MAKRLGKQHNGNYRIRCGTEKLLDGTTKQAEFWIGNDADAAKLKRARIKAEWAKVQAVGGDAWPDEVLRGLGVEGVINKRFITKATASKIIGPLPASDAIEQFKDKASGLVKAEHAYTALELMVQTLIALPANQQKFVEAFQRELARDPVGTIYRAAGQFGWGRGQASTLIGILNQSGGGPPIAFDASERKEPDAIDGSVITNEDSDCDS